MRITIEIDGKSYTGDVHPVGGVSTQRPPPPSDGSAIFPPYGRSKGMPVAGATMNDLEFYANGSRRTLADPSKLRFHEKERAFLAILEAEISRQDGGAGAGFDPPPPSDADAPPPMNDDIPF